MPEVPYDPIPNVQPTERPLRVFGVPNVPAAFGENVARALDLAGGQVAKGGEEVFNRGVWLQELNNQSTAREAQNQYAIQSSDLHAKYGALTGKEAVDALPQYFKDQTALRESLGANLNTMARRYYDADSMPFMQRNLFSAAGHAAGQNKRWTIQTSKDEAQLEIDGAEDHPNARPEDHRKRMNEAILRASMNESGDYDPNSPINREVVLKANSAFDLRRIQGLAKIGDIPGAEALMKTAKLTDADELRAISIMETRGTSLYATRLANQVTSRHLTQEGTFDVSVKQMGDELDEETAKHPEYPQLPTTARAILERITNQHRYDTRVDALDGGKELREAIVSNDIHDPEALQNIPGIEKSLMKIPASQRSAAALQNTINATWDSLHKASNKDMMNQLSIMKNDDVMRWQNIDPADPKLGLSYDDQMKLRREQQDFIKNPRQDTRALHAISVIKGAYGNAMIDMGLIKADKQTPVDPGDYYHFMGALSEWLQEHLDRTGKPASDKEIIDEAWPFIRRRHLEKGYGIFSPDEEFDYKTWTRPDVVPNAERQQIIEESLKELGRVPGEPDIRRIYAAREFNRLFSEEKEQEVQTYKVGK